MVKFYIFMSDFQTMNYELQKLKMKYIPMFARGEISERECARLVGIQPVSVWRLKMRWLKSGDSIWIHGNTGRTPKNKKYDWEKIRADYKKFSGTPFMSFRDNCADYLDYSALPSYTTFYNALSSAGIISPRARIPVREKKKHLPRKERPNEGDLIQIDASLHDWFMNGTKIALHGAIDDATHKIEALYFCKSECPLGYFNLLLQIFRRTCGLFPRAIYSDRSSCFFAVSGAKRSSGKKSETQWQKTCRELNIKLIPAYSPQAKGRIERLWQTLQGRLPYIFRFLGIDTAEKANEFLPDFIEKFNARFSVPAQNPEPHWQSPPADADIESLFSICTENKSCKK